MCPDCPGWQEARQINGKKKPSLVAVSVLCNVFVKHYVFIELDLTFQKIRCCMKMVGMISVNLFFLGHLQNMSFDSDLYGLFINSYIFMKQKLNNLHHELDFMSNHVSASTSWLEYLYSAYAFADLIYSSGTQNALL